MANDSRERRPPLRRSLQEYGRGIAGGLIFSLPLLYTMEVWAFGVIVRPSQLLVYIGFTFLLLLGYNRYAGLRPDAHWIEVVIDSIEEMGIGLCLATAVLIVVGQVTWEMPDSEVLGKIVLEAMTVAIGVSVGTAQLGGDAHGETNAEEPEREPPVPKLHEQIVIAVCGAMLFGANVAPTEEIVRIALAVSPWHLLAMVGVSLLLGTLILFFSDFPGAKRFVYDDEGVARIAGKSALNYVIALASAAAILWFFGRFEGLTPAVILAQVVVLAVATTLGASAGRLLLQ